MDARIKAQLLGAIIGAGIGYFVGQWYIDNFLPVEWPDDEIYPEDDKGRTVSEKEFIIVKKEEKPKRISRVAPIRDYSAYFKEHGRPDLAALAAKYNNDDIIEELDKEVLEERMDQAFDEELLEDPTEEKDPRIISIGEFVNEDDEFNKITVYYYPEDDILTDHLNNPVPNPEAFLGDDALMSFGLLSDDPDIVYVRNEAMQCCYEVVLRNERYAAIPEVRKPERKMRNEEGDVET